MGGKQRRGRGELGRRRKSKKEGNIEREERKTKEDQVGGNQRRGRGK